MGVVSTRQHAAEALQDVRALRRHQARSWDVVNTRDRRSVIVTLDHLLDIVVTDAKGGGLSRFFCYLASCVPVRCAIPGDISICHLVDSSACLISSPVLVCGMFRTEWSSGFLLRQLWQSWRSRAILYQDAESFTVRGLLLRMCLYNTMLQKLMLLTCGIIFPL